MNLFSILFFVSLFPIISPISAKSPLESDGNQSLNSFPFQINFNQFGTEKYSTDIFPPWDITYIESQKNRQSLPVYDGNSSDWHPLGPSNWQPGGYPGIGRVQCITFHPSNNNIIFIGTPGGGLWKSTNGGINWSTNTDNTANLTVLGISDILINPVNPDIMYIATGDPDGKVNACPSIGVLKSTNGGNNWNNTGLTFPVSAQRKIHRLVMDPLNPSILLAGTDSGLWKTINGGSNFLQKTSGYINDIKFKPVTSSDDTIYASGRVFLRSTDNGESFNTISSGIPDTGITRIAIGITAANPNFVYCIAVESDGKNFQGLYLSTNSGLSFTKNSNKPNILGHNNPPPAQQDDGQGGYDLAIAISPVDPMIVYTGGVNVWKSTNGGLNGSWNMQSYWNWSPMSPDSFTHADIHTLVFNQSGDSIYCGSDGGILKTTTSSEVSWINLTADLSITQFYKIAGTPQDPNLILGGCQDNGTFKYDNSVWTSYLLGGDGVQGVAIDYTDLNIYYAVTDGTLKRSTNAGANFTTIHPNGNDFKVTSYILDPIVHTTLFAGFTNNNTSKIWKSTNQGNNWDTLKTFRGSIQNVVVSQSNHDYIYCSVDNFVHRTTDGGSNWLISSPDSLTITDIIIHPTNPNRAFVSATGYRAEEKIFYSSNSGINWVNITGTSLPNVPANCLVFESGSSYRLYVGTDVGVYYMDSSMSEWIAFMNGLPKVKVTDLVIDTTVMKIRAATYGRGLWESPLGISISIIPISGNTPFRFELSQNYPNPFNPNTKIKFALPKSSFATLIVFDALGREAGTLVHEQLNAGTYEVVWNADKFSSGVYYYQISAGDFTETKKMVLVK